jgi:hypothetical protein
MDGVWVPGITLMNKTGLKYKGKNISLNIFQNYDLIHLGIKAYLHGGHWATE